LRSNLSVTTGARQIGTDAEILAVTALLALAISVGLATVGDYAIVGDEFNADSYGSKALAWYTTGFTTARVSRRWKTLCGTMGRGSTLPRLKAAMLYVIAAPKAMIVSQCGALT
jgi:hypothetical protein